MGRNGDEGGYRRVQLRRRTDPCGDCAPDFELDPDVDAEPLNDPEDVTEALLPCCFINDSDLFPLSVSGFDLDLVELDLSRDDLGFGGAPELLCLPLESLLDPFL
ncbi:hypothetical protein FGB62_197g02 [Gracilaria domingensis]|nr:hypothetical protein FGB62_197g02 [Gracilaria domingensis]